jgi:hypothetical protein
MATGEIALRWSTRPPIGSGHKTSVPNSDKSIKADEGIIYRLKQGIPGRREASSTDMSQITYQRF